MHIHMIEEQRLQLQDRLDEQKTQAERNQLGQFATPPALARSILAYSLALLPAQTVIQFLDPAIGTGAFYAALRNLTGSEHIKAAAGFECDAHYAQPAQTLWQHTALQLHQADFTTTIPPQTEQERFNLVICNPPYVRHHHLPSTEKVRLQTLTAPIFGTKIHGLAGLYCYFIGLAHLWMQRGAIGSWLIPSEFMSVNYGQAVRHYLTHQVTLLRMHRFDPCDQQFDAALVSSAIIFFKNEPPRVQQKVEYSYGGTLQAPQTMQYIPISELATQQKWTRSTTASLSSASAKLQLKHIFTIKRGIATGNNKFFILTPEQIKVLELPSQFLQPILPSPRYLHDEEIFTDACGVPTNIKQLFLLNCRLPETELKLNYPTLWNYLQTGKPHVAQRYLCSKRTPWYSQEHRPATPFLCTYIGRTNGSRRPFRFILNHSQATAANVYLLLYPKPPLAALLAQNHNLTREVWHILQAIQLNDLLDEGRVYGGGLYKLEPRELANVPVADMHTLLAHHAPKQLALL